MQEITSYVLTVKDTFDNNNVNNACIQYIPVCNVIPVIQSNNADFTAEKDNEMNKQEKQVKILEEALNELSRLEDDNDTYEQQSFDANLYMAVLVALRKVDDRLEEVA